MIEQLRLADGTQMPLPPPGQRLALAAAELESDPPGAWLTVLDAGAGVVVNGRPVQALAWLHAGDRVCVGSLAFDLLGAPPPDTALPVRSFLLRRRGGAGAGSLMDGPVLSFDGEGQPVSAAAAALTVALSGGRIGVAGTGAPAWLNGHPLASDAVLVPGDQLRIGRARYLVEALSEPMPEPVTRRLPVADPAPPATGGNASGLGWLILLAAVLAALIAALIYV